MPNKKFKANPELNCPLKEEANNWKSQSLAIKNFFSAEFSSLEKEVFLSKPDQIQTTQKKSSIRPFRFYISSDNNEDNCNVRQRCNTL